MRRHWCRAGAAHVCCRETGCTLSNVKLPHSLCPFAGAARGWIACGMWPSASSNGVALQQKGNRRSSTFNKALVLHASAPSYPFRAAPPLLPHRKPRTRRTTQFLDLSETRGPPTSERNLCTGTGSTNKIKLCRLTQTHTKTAHLACCFKLAVYIACQLPTPQFNRIGTTFSNTYYNNFLNPHNKHEILKEVSSRLWPLEEAQVSSQLRTGATMNKGVPLMLLAATVILLWLPLVLPPLSPPPLFLLFVPVVMMLLLFSLVLFPSHHCAYPSPTLTQ